MPVLLVLLPCLLWGTTGTAASFLPGVDPLAIGASAQGAGGVLYFLLYARSSSRVIASRATWHWAAIGALGTAGYPLTYYPSLQFGGVALGTTVALGSAPVFASLIELVFDGTRLTWRWAAGTALGIVGVLLLAFGSARGPGETAPANLPLALVLALAAGLSYALYTYASRRAIRLGAPPTAAMGAMFAESSVVLIPILVIAGGPLVASWHNLGIAAYLAVGPLCLAYIMFAKGLAKVSASLATTITLAEPAVAAVLAVFVVGETITGYGWLGIALIAAGILLASLPARPKLRADVQPTG